MSAPDALLLIDANGDYDPALSTPASLGPHDPFALGRRVAYQGLDGVAAGIVRFVGRLQIDAFAHAETVVVHAGQVVLRSAGLTLELTPGSSAVIGRGTTFEIEAQSEALWAFCSVSATRTPVSPGLTLLDPRDLLYTSAAPEEQILIGPTPQCRAHNAFEDKTSGLKVGVWDSTPYRRRERAHKLNELMHLIEGSVSLTSSGGNSVQANPGDSVFVPVGAPCAWTSTVYVRKFYAVI